jgi:hypothetical protein
MPVDVCMEMPASYKWIIDFVVLFHLFSVMMGLIRSGVGWIWIFLVGFI